MRKALLLLSLAVAACATKDEANTDSAAGTVAGGNATTPRRLTAADIAGTWTGMSMSEGSDSTMSHWTSTYVNDSTGTLTSSTSSDTISYSVKYDADSMIATSKPYTMTASPKAPVVFRSVGRLKDGKLVGTNTITLAAKPDSVVARSHWEATKKQP